MLAKNRFRLTKELSSLVHLLAPPRHPLYPVGFGCFIKDFLYRGTPYSQHSVFPGKTESTKLLVQHIVQLSCKRDNDLHKKILQVTSNINLLLHSCFVCGDLLYYPWLSVEAIYQLVQGPEIKGFYWGFEGKLASTAWDIRTCGIAQMHMQLGYLVKNVIIIK